MSTKRRKKVSLKQYVVKLTEAVIDHCCKQFGYSKKPILKERQMPNSFYAFQAKDSKRRRYVIYYNYRMFLGFCKGDSSIDSLVYLIVSTAAHECRHYYQYRQVCSKKPRESEETLAAWKYDFEHYGEKNRAENTLEIDASDFSYRYLEEYFGLKGLKEAVENIEKEV